MKALLDAIKPGALIALDTAAWIYELEDHLEFGQVTHSVFVDLIGEGRNPAGTTTLTLGELLVRPLSMGRVDIADKYREIIRPGVGFSVWEITRQVIEQAAELRAHHRLKMLDALHLSAAILHGASVFVTNDRDLKRVSGIDVLLIADYVSAAPEQEIDPDASAQGRPV